MSSSPPGLGECHVSKIDRASATTVLAALLLLDPSIGHAGRPDGAPIPTGELSNVSIDNFGRVDATCYRGAEPPDDQYAALAELGVKTVVDLRSDDVDAEDKLLVERAGMTYVRIPMTTHKAPTSGMVEIFLKIVTDAANQPVYVHCVGGRDRTGVMTAVYRMTHDHWSADQAFQEIEAAQFGADFLHPEFKKFVYGYRAGPILGAKPWA